MQWNISEDIATVKKLIEGINTEELKKSFVDLESKVSGIIDTLSNSTVGKGESNDDSDEDKDSYKRNRIL